MVRICETMGVALLVAVVAAANEMRPLHTKKLTKDNFEAFIQDMTKARKVAVVRWMLSADDTNCTWIEKGLFSPVLMDGEERKKVDACAVVKQQAKAWAEYTSKHASNDKLAFGDVVLADSPEVVKEVQAIHAKYPPPEIEEDFDHHFAADDEEASAKDGKEEEEESSPEPADDGGEAGLHATVGIPTDDGNATLPASGEMYAPKDDLPPLQADEGEMKEGQTFVDVPGGDEEVEEEEEPQLDKDEEIDESKLMHGPIHGKENQDPDTIHHPGQPDIDRLALVDSDSPITGSVDSFFLSQALDVVSMPEVGGCTIRTYSMMEPPARMAFSPHCKELLDPTHFILPVR